tara:strand:+ start:648 stop:911 length:264 start_codon:yes stop_codon:yes gene_type:complete
MEIRNLTPRPLKVPLPAGKRLFLSPKGKGQVAHKDLEHPPLKALIDSGDVEVFETGRNKGPSSDGKSGSGGSQDGGGGAGMRHTGDR